MHELGERVLFDSGSFLCLDVDGRFSDGEMTDLDLI